MTMTADHAARRGRLATRLTEQGIDGFVVSDPRNVHYLTGFRGSYGYVLVADDLAILVTDGRYEERAARDAPGVDLAVDRDWVAAVTDRAHQRGLDRVGFESTHLSYRTAWTLIERMREKGIDAVADAGLVESFRRIKDADEIAALRRACELTDDAFGSLVDAGAVSARTERQIALFLERAMIDAGAEAVAFDAIVASGPNGSIPHHQPTDRAVAVGDLVTMDFGARVDGYHADMTRTVAVGDPAPELVEVAALVRDAQALGVAAAVAGTDIAAVDAACRERIAAAGHGDHFLHPTGHAVGLEIHEWPTVAASTSGSLEAGMVITVEPGVYLPGVGGVRIEDTILITSDGPPERLTTSSRELLRL